MLDISKIIRNQRDKIFLKHKDKIYTYGDLENRISLICNELSRYSIKEIAFVGDRDFDHFAFVISCIILNIPVYIFYPTWPENKIKEQLNNCNIADIVFGKQIYNETKNYSCNEYVIDDGYIVKKNEMPDVRNNKDSQEFRIYLSTSGTTGDNKWNCYKIETILDNMRVLANQLSISEKDCLHIVLPLYTSNGITISFFLPFSQGASIFLDDELTIYNINQYIYKGYINDVTVVSLVPSIVRILNRVNMDECNLKKTKVRFSICGTSALHVSDSKKFEEKYGFPIYLNYGLTETLFVSSQNETFHSDNSSGGLLKGVIVEIDNNMIKIKSPYFSDNLTQNDSYENGYFTSGDLGKIVNNELHVEGRNKEQIIKNGYNINPNEIKNIIAKYNGINDCFVFGYPDKLMGEEVICAVVTNDMYDENELMKYMNKNIPKYMRPKILKIDRLPTNDTGKVLKSELLNLLNTK